MKSFHHLSFNSRQVHLRTGVEEKDKHRGAAVDVHKVCVVCFCFDNYVFSSVNIFSLLTTFLHFLIECCFLTKSDI